MNMDLNGTEYNVIRLLGKGKGGYSYLVSDGRSQYVLKQIHHEPCDYYQFGDKLASELRDYARLRKVGIPMPELLSVDERQERLLKTFIEGPTVYDLVLRDAVRPEYVQQVEQMCGLLYPNGLNIDYFPTNFVVQDEILYYIDFECNGYMEQWDFRHWGEKYWSQTPEFLEYAREKGDLDEFPVAIFP